MCGVGWERWNDRRLCAAAEAEKHEQCEGEMGDGRGKGAVSYIARKHVSRATRWGVCHVGILRHLRFWMSRRCRELHLWASIAPGSGGQMRVRDTLRDSL